MSQASRQSGAAMTQKTQGTVAIFEAPEMRRRFDSSFLNSFSEYFGLASVVVDVSYFIGEILKLRGKNPGRWRIHVKQEAQNLMMG